MFVHGSLRVERVLAVPPPSRGLPRSAEPRAAACRSRPAGGLEGGSDHVAAMRLDVGGANDTVLLLLVYTVWPRIRPLGSAARERAGERS